MRAQGEQAARGLARRLATGECRGLMTGSGGTWGVLKAGLDEMVGVLEAVQ